MILPVAVAKIIITIDVVGESVVEVIQWEIMMKIIIAPLAIIIITTIIEDIIMITGEVGAGEGDIAVVAMDMTMTLIITATTSMDGTEGGHLVERRPTLPSHMPQNPCFVNSFGRRNSKRMTGRNVCKRRRQRRRKMVMST
jgi:hypothetical protein